MKSILNSFFFLGNPVEIKLLNKQNSPKAQLDGAVEYTDSISAEG